MQPVASRLTDLTALVRPELDLLNGQLLEELRPREADLQPLVERALGFRGKQLRPALVFLAARAIRPDLDPMAGAPDLGGRTGPGDRLRNGASNGASNGSSAANGRGHVPASGRRLHGLLTVAKVVELIHTASLVHDDVLDGASMRRKLQTINSLHGTEVPVLLGDYVYARSFSLAVSLDDPTCGRVLGDVVRRMCQGEITQIFHRFDFDWSVDRYLDVIHDKTATLYAASAQLGAHYGGADADVAEALGTYGREFGIAFQIIDDCLDLVGDEEVVGKSLGTDLRSGKLTLPLLELMRDRAQGERLRHLMTVGFEGLSDLERLERLRAEFPLRAAIDTAVATAHERIGLALDALSVLGESEAKDTLTAIAEYVLTRKL